VHNWANLELVQMFRCYDNIHVCKLIACASFCIFLYYCVFIVHAAFVRIKSMMMMIALCSANAYSAERKMSASACTRPMPGLCCFPTFTDLSVQLLAATMSNRNLYFVFIACRSVTEKNGRWHVADATADCWLATHAQVGRLHQTPGLFLAVFKLPQVIEQLERSNVAF